VSPGDALAELLAGNERFLHGEPEHPNQDAPRRAALARAQEPFAVVFGCSDSRLAAEIIFDRGLGDLFVVRTAGHIIGPEVAASIEYGVTVLGAPLLVVLGHDSCGAVRATYDTLAGLVPPAPGLRAIVDGIRPSLAPLPVDPMTPGMDPSVAPPRLTVDLDEVSAEHVRRTVAALSANPGIAPAVAAGTCAVVGLTYRLAEGRIAVVSR
jgi:carbonic anhydrase